MMRAGSDTPTNRMSLAASTVCFLIMATTVSVDAAPARDSAKISKENKVDIKAARQTFADYLTAWAVSNEGERQHILAKTVNADIRYFDTLARLKGRDELASHLGGFQARRPGYRFALDNFMAHNDVALANWAMHDDTGKTVVRGYDSVHFDAAGHIDSIIGFSDVAAQKGE